MNFLHQHQHYWQSLRLSNQRLSGRTLHTSDSDQSKCGRRYVVDSQHRLQLMGHDLYAPKNPQSLFAIQYLEFPLHTSNHLLYHRSERYERFHLGQLLSMSCILGTYLMGLILYQPDSYPMNRFYPLQSSISRNYGLGKPRTCDHSYRLQSKIHNPDYLLRPQFGMTKQFQCMRQRGDHFHIDPLRR